MIVRFLTLILTCLLFSASGYADPIVPAVYSVFVTSNLFGTVFQMDTSALSASVGTAMAFPPTPGIALAQAIAGPNDLGVYGGVSVLSTVTVSSSTAVESVATLNDTLLLSGAPTSGILDVVENVRGDETILDFGTGFALTQTFLRVSASGGTACAALTSNGSASECGLLEDGLNDFRVPYVMSPNGTIAFGGEFFTFDTCDKQEAPGFNSCFGQSSFLDTAQIASITIDDANGNPVPGATFSSLSGVDYSLPQTATPEPSSFVLFGTGMICVVGTMMRRRLSTTK